MRPISNKLFVIPVSLCLAFLLTLCDKTDKIDITERQWELIKVKSDGKRMKKPDEDSNKPDAYVLRFKNDTMFLLDTDVNAAGGVYSIPKKGRISISKYGNWSSAGSINNEDFNDKMIEVFNEVNSYKVKKGFRMTLTFEGPKGEVKFKEK